MAKKRLNGEGTYRQRPDGVWEGRITLPGGKRLSRYGKTQEVARAKLAAAIKAAGQGLRAEAATLTVAAYLELWLRDAVKDSVRLSTYEDYAGIVRVRVAPRIGKRKLCKLDGLVLQGLYGELKEAGLQPASIRKTHRVLHAAFRQAVAWDVLAHNPCDRVKAPKVERTEMQAWTPAQAQQFLSATAEHHMHALYVVALSTGMRRGELLGLRWADIDLNAGTLSVQRSLSWRSITKYTFTAPKTARSRRTIHLSRAAIEALRAHKDRQTFARRDAGSAWADQDLVFCNAAGGPLDPTNQSTTFQRAAERVAAAAKKAADEAGIKDAPPFPIIRFHDMRHTAASLLLAQGVHVKLVSEMLGHSTVSLTLDTYSHVIPAMHGDAARAMDRVFSVG